MIPLLVCGKTKRIMAFFRVYVSINCRNLRSLLPSKYGTIRKNNGPIMKRILGIVDRRRYTGVRRLQDASLQMVLDEELRSLSLFKKAFHVAAQGG